MTSDVDKTLHLGSSHEPVGSKRGMQVDSNRASSKRPAAVNGKHGKIRDHIGEHSVLSFNPCFEAYCHLNVTSAEQLKQIFNKTKISMNMTGLFLMVSVRNGFHTGNEILQYFLTALQNSYSPKYMCHYYILVSNTGDVQGIAEWSNAHMLGRKIKEGVEMRFVYHDGQVGSHKLRVHVVNTSLNSTFRFMKPLLEMVKENTSLIYSKFNAACFVNDRFGRGWEEETIGSKIHSLSSNDNGSSTEHGSLLNLARVSQQEFFSPTLQDQNISMPPSANSLGTTSANAAMNALKDMIDFGMLHKLTNRGV